VRKGDDEYESELCSVVELKISRSATKEYYNNNNNNNNNNNSENTKTILTANSRNTRTLN